jgi:hypothetical protein
LPNFVDVISSPGSAGKTKATRVSIIREVDLALCDKTYLLEDVTRFHSDDSKIIHKMTMSRACENGKLDAQHKSRSNLCETYLVGYAGHGGSGGVKPLGRRQATYVCNGDPRCDPLNADATIEQPTTGRKPPGSHC